MINTPLNGGGADEKVTIHEEQIVFALKQAELGTSVPNVCRKLGVSDATFYTWRKKYGEIPLLISNTCGSWKRKICG